MLDPSHLPTELFDNVISYALEGKSDFKTLYGLSLLSRQWYAAVEAHLYSGWTYDGELQSIPSLWKFLRTILRNRRLADRVYKLNIQNWTFGFVQESNRFVLSEEDSELVQIAIEAAKLQHIEGKFMTALSKADPRPLMALLLTSLRNL